MVQFNVLANIFEIDSVLLLDDDMVNGIENDYALCVSDSPGGLSSGCYCTGILNPSVTAVFPVISILKQNVAQFLANFGGLLKSLRQPKG